MKNREVIRITAAIVGLSDGVLDTMIVPGRRVHDHIKHF